MQAIFRFIPNNALRAVDHVGHDLFATVGGQAVHENGVFVGFGQFPGARLLIVEDVPTFGIHE